MAQNDEQWLASQPSNVLEAYVKSGDSLALLDFPPHCRFSIDSRTYSQAMTHILGLSPTTIHLVTLSLAAPTASVAIFIPAMRGGHAAVRYDDITVSLVAAASPAASLPPVGSRGVGVLSRPARADWDALAGLICEATLLSAHMPSLRSAEAPELEAWPRARPRAGATGAEITQFGMDASPRVLAVVQSRYGGRFGRVLGELQIAFVGFLYMGSVDALMHWAAVVKEVCGCFALFEDAEEALLEFEGVLGAQLQLLDCDVRDAFKGLGLKTAVRRFWGYFKERNKDKRIAQWLTTAEDEEESGDEDGPTVVELD